MDPNQIGAVCEVRLASKRDTLRPLIDHFVTSLVKKGLDRDDIFVFTRSMMAAWEATRLSLDDAEKKYFLATRQSPSRGDPAAMDVFYRLLHRERSGGGVGRDAAMDGLAKDATTASARMAVDFFASSSRTRLILANLERAKKLVCEMGFPNDDESGFDLLQSLLSSAVGNAAFLLNGVTSSKGKSSSSTSVVAYRDARNDRENKEAGFIRMGKHFAWKVKERHDNKHKFKLPKEEAEQIAQQFIELLQKAEFSYRELLHRYQREAQKERGMKATGSDPFLDMKKEMFQQIWSKSNVEGVETRQINNVVDITVWFFEHARKKSSPFLG